MKKGQEQGPHPAPPAMASVTEVSTVLSRRQLMSGSCTKASSMAITLSLLVRSTRITSLHVALGGRSGLQFKPRARLLCTGAAASSGGGSSKPPHPSLQNAQTHTCTVTHHNCPPKKTSHPPPQTHHHTHTHPHALPT